MKLMRDWGADVVCWVLPEAKMIFLLKDLKKGDQILVKLATHPNNCTSYSIPRNQIVPIVPGAILKMNGTQSND